MLEDFSIKTIKVYIIRYCNCKKIYNCATVVSYLYDAIAQWYSQKLFFNCLSLTFY